MANFTYNWNVYGKRNVGAVNDYLDKNVVRPTSTYKPKEYNDSAGTYARDIALARAALDQTNRAKPVTYQSQYSDRMNQIASDMGNRKFSYDVNSDALFQQLKSIYDEQGKLAGANAAGQAAALTGGYGNSYGTTAATQAILQNNEKLYDRIPELQQMALQRYQQEGTDKQNAYAMLADLESSAYGKYRDQYSDWENERAYRDNALRNYQSMNQNIWGQNEQNRYNANNQRWDVYQRALEMARNLRNDDVSYNQWADEATESSKQSAWNRAFSEAQAQDNNAQNAAELAYRYAALNASNSASENPKSKDTEPENKVDNMADFKKRLKSESKFKKDSSMVRKYGSYKEYVSAMINANRLLSYDERVALMDAYKLWKI